MIRGEDGKFKPKGVGVRHGANPLTVKVAPELRAIIDALPDKPDRLRRWIFEGMQRDGLIGGEAIAPEPTEETPAAPPKRRRRKNGDA